jgi:hypothetical protein
MRPGDAHLVRQNSYRTVVGALALNVEYTRKYGFDAGAAGKVEATLVAVPAPSVFLAALQAGGHRRAQRAAAARPED